MINTYNTVTNFLYTATAPLIRKVVSYVGSLKEHSRVVCGVRSQRVLRTIKASVLYVTPLCPECPPKMKMKITDEFSPVLAYSLG